MDAQESLEAFRLVVTTAAGGQIVVSTGDLSSRINLWIRQGDKGEKSADAGEEHGTSHPRPALATAYLAPNNDVERTITRVWQELLGVDKLGIHDNFFELGGNSLIALKVIARLKKELNVDIPIVSLFEGPTVNALAAVITQDPDEIPSYETRQSRGERRREKRLRTHISGNDPAPESPTLTGD
jgi:acyl carrier protein